MDRQTMQRIGRAAHCTIEIVDCEGTKGRYIIQRVIARHRDTRMRRTLGKFDKVSQMSEDDLAALIASKFPVEVKL